MPATVSVAVKRVIVADDTAFVRDRFRTALEQAGHQAITVASGPELLARLREEWARIDLIVLDVRLPQGRGVDIVKAIRAIDQGRIPIVVFSGTIANADEVRELTGLSVVHYVNEYTSAPHIVPALKPHLFPDSRNRRESPRVVLSVPVSYRFGNTIAAAVTLNISSGGLAIRTTSPLDVDTDVRVRFRLPSGGGEIDAMAKVAWADRRFGMGVRFTAVDGDARRAITEFVDTHFFSNRKA
jgi:uncharacterized protein (TIGR02266 family)